MHHKEKDKERGVGGREKKKRRRKQTMEGGRRRGREGGGGEEKGEREDKWTNKQYQEQKEKLKRIGREV